MINGKPNLQSPYPRDSSSSGIRFPNSVSVRPTSPVYTVVTEEEERFLVASSLANKSGYNKGVVSGIKTTSVPCVVSSLSNNNSLSRRSCPNSYDCCPSKSYDWDERRILENKKARTKLLSGYDSERELEENTLHSKNCTLKTDKNCHKNGETRECAAKRRVKENLDHEQQFKSLRSGKKSRDLDNSSECRECYLQNSKNSSNFVPNPSSVVSGKEVSSPSSPVGNPQLSVSPIVRLTPLTHSGGRPKTDVSGIHAKSGTMVNGCLKSNASAPQTVTFPSEISPQTSNFSPNPSKRVAFPNKTATFPSELSPVVSEFSDDQIFRDSNVDATPYEDDSCDRLGASPPDGPVTSNAVAEDQAFGKPLNDDQTAAHKRTIYGTDVTVLLSSVISRSVSYLKDKFFSSDALKDNDNGSEMPGPGPLNEPRAAEVRGKGKENGIMTRGKENKVDNDDVGHSKPTSASIQNDETDDEDDVEISDDGGQSGSDHWSDLDDNDHWSDLDDNNSVPPIKRRKRNRCAIRACLSDECKELGNLHALLTLNPPVPGRITRKTFHKLSSRHQNKGIKRLKHSQNHKLRLNLERKLLQANKDERTGMGKSLYVDSSSCQKEQTGSDNVENSTKFPTQTEQNINSTATNKNSSSNESCVDELSLKLTESIITNLTNGALGEAFACSVQLNCPRLWDSVNVVENGNNAVENGDNLVENGDNVVENGYRRDRDGRFLSSPGRDRDGAFLSRPGRDEGGRFLSSPGREKSDFSKAPNTSRSPKSPSIMDSLRRRTKKHVDQEPPITWTTSSVPGSESPRCSSPFQIILEPGGMVSRIFDGPGDAISNGRSIQSPDTAVDISPKWKLRRPTHDGRFSSPSKCNAEGNSHYSSTGSHYLGAGSHYPGSGSHYPGAGFQNSGSDNQGSSPSPRGQPRKADVDRLCGSAVPDSASKKTGKRKRLPQELKNLISDEFKEFRQSGFHPVDVVVAQVGDGLSEDRPESTTGTRTELSPENSCNSQASNTENSSFNTSSNTSSSSSSASPFKRQVAFKRTRPSWLWKRKATASGHSGVLGTTASDHSGVLEATASDHSGVLGTTASDHSGADNKAVVPGSASMKTGKRKRLPHELKNLISDEWKEFRQSGFHPVDVVAQVGDGLPADRAGSKTGTGSGLSSRTGKCPESKIGTVTSHRASDDDSMDGYETDTEEGDQSETEKSFGRKTKTRRFGSRENDFSVPRPIPESVRDRSYFSNIKSDVTSKKSDVIINRSRVISNRSHASTERNHRPVKDRRILTSDSDSSSYSDSDSDEDISKTMKDSQKKKTNYKPKRIPNEVRNLIKDECKEFKAHGFHPIDVVTRLAPSSSSEDEESWENLALTTRKKHTMDKVEDDETGNLTKIMALRPKKRDINYDDEARVRADVVEVRDDEDKVPDRKGYSGQFGTVQVRDHDHEVRDDDTSSGTDDTDPPSYPTTNASKPRIPRELKNLLKDEYKEFRDRLNLQKINLSKKEFLTPLSSETTTNGSDGHTFVNLHSKRTPQSLERNSVVSNSHKTLQETHRGWQFSRNATKSGMACHDDGMYATPRGLHRMTLKEENAMCVVSYVLPHIM
ncbi:uncharacterized protein LOC108671503 [Hyalella azteca]|uniref:Uncharacterized protein LOC108671503 n=1 Tax=Hyalella azteca TaxID=294128 RepID=A0A8B7NLJ8_HYAAZ|nr:uncharacterized protein LOC108671503 [Hyalella azteca]